MHGATIRKTLHVSDSSSVHHQQFFTVHTAMVYVIQDQDGTAVPSWSCSQAVSKPLWHTPMLCVQWKTPDDGQRNCPKHVEFQYKNKFVKLVHLVGFIIRIYHDARSPERQKTSNSRKQLQWQYGFRCFRCKQKVTVNFVMSVPPSVRMEISGSQWTDCHEIWYLIFFWESVEKIQMLLKSYEDNEH